jgi:hypothetical protein
VLKLFNLYSVKLDKDERHLVKTIFACSRWDIQGMNHFENTKQWKKLCEEDNQILNPSETGHSGYKAL